MSSGVRGPRVSWEIRKHHLGDMPLPKLLENRNALVYTAGNIRKFVEWEALLRSLTGSIREMEQRIEELRPGLVSRLEPWEG